uniref:Peroxidase-like protein n=1 Tax=Euprymna scolopes TaxID=6613 RepID=Q24926_EUPSC|nr:peroxidase-like protein [Euprymna scolopes]
MRITPLLLLVVLPCIVTCLTPISDDLCHKAYEKACRKVRSGRDFAVFRSRGGRTGGSRNSAGISDVAGAVGTDGVAGAAGNTVAAAAAAAARAAGATDQGVAAAVAAGNAAAAAVEAGADAATIAEAAAAAAVAVVVGADAEAVNNATAAAVAAAEAVGADADVIAEVAAVAAAAAAEASVAGAEDAAIAEAAAVAAAAAIEIAIATANATAAAALVNAQAAETLANADLIIAETGLIFVETARLIQDLLDQGLIDAENLVTAVQPPLELVAACPFLTALTCDADFPYRTADGSCNNLVLPYLGRSSTPFERYLPAVYEDGLDLPRATGVLGGALPGARLISTNFHGFSTPADRDDQLTHLTTLFGVFLNHDLQIYPSMPTSGGDLEESIDCCNSDNTAVCYPIDIPVNDTYFGVYGRTCMEFVRSLASPALTCGLGPREQLNTATGYIDASQVYGSDIDRQLLLRAMEGGLMRTTPTDDLDLMPQDNSTFCRAAEGNLCFIGGDGRVNVQPMMMSLHHLFVREHNRLANIISSANPDWTDEVIFQETRKLVIAEMQHVTYNEYLPKIVGPTMMETYSLNTLTQGYSMYLANINPSIRNGFASAGIIYSHSGLRSLITIGDSQNTLSSLFYNSDVFYSGTDAPTLVFQGLTTDMAQGIDRLMTEELTNKLVETAPGNGWDLAAIKLQAGRDIGLPTYNAWAQWCGLDVATNFTTLADHSEDDANLLATVYTSVEDIDVWTGGVSEIPIEGGSVGPLFACIAARQFQALKMGDRFWYENAGPNQLSVDTVNAIRNVTMSRLICDNTNIQQIQGDAFIAASETNPVVDCSSLPTADQCSLVRTYSAWTAWSDCINNQRVRTRTCLTPATGACSCDGVPAETQIGQCNVFGPAA